MQNHDRRSIRQSAVAVTIFFCIWGCAATADAFCGFYVSDAAEGLHNDATAVSLMRKGRATVMAMENNYLGPPKDFAMVVPVPEVLEKKQVKTLDAEVFDRLKKQTAPRLVEYWEQDPCPEPRRPRAEASRGLGALGGAADTAARTGSAQDKVRVKAKFSVGEYDIVILDSSESNALEDWLHERRYKIPKGAATYFEPYVQQGSYFFVAKVNVDKLKFSEGRAQLSPLRFHYESEDFKLPIRLGLINSNGMQDLLAFTIAKGQRYEVANRKNVRIPTNLVVDESVKGDFAGFYERLFARTVREYEDPVVTEYAWRAGKCDPCPVEPMSRSDFRTLGGDVIFSMGEDAEQSDLMEESLEVDLEGAKTEALEKRLQRYRRRGRSCARRTGAQREIDRGNVVLDFTIGPSGRVRSMEIVRDDFGGAANCMASTLFSVRFRDVFEMSVRAPVGVRKVYKFRELDRRRARGPRGWTITRLHYRYDKERGGRDLVFEEAEPMRGGRGTPRGTVEDGISFPRHRGRARVNHFQGRYMVLHPWSREIDCENPRRGRWGRRGRGVKTHSGRPTSSELSGTLDDLVREGEVPGPSNNDR